MTETSWDESIKGSAKKIGELLDDMVPFNDLEPHWPNAGKFELAQWLERIVDDRRNAIVVHANHLRIAFESMQTTLTQIVDDFDNADGDNAKGIKDALGDLKDKIEGEIDEWDENTEKDWGNFSADEEGNGVDGDGYDDNLSVPLGEDEEEEEDEEEDDEDEDDDEDDEDDEDEDDEDDEDEDDEDDDDDDESDPDDTQTPD